MKGAAPPHEQHACLQLTDTLQWHFFASMVRKASLGSAEASEQLGEVGLQCLSGLF